MDKYRRTGKRYAPVGGVQNNQVGMLVRVVAYIVLLLGIVAGIVAAAAGEEFSVLVLIIALLAAFFSFVLLLGFSEIIILLQMKQSQHYEELERIPDKKPESPDNASNKVWEE